MKRQKLIFLIVVVALSAAVLFAQDIKTIITGANNKPALAVVDFRGTGASQQFMGAFNSTLYNDLQSSGLFDLRPKSMFPLGNPQSPNDLRTEDAGGGFALQDWSGAPVNASHLVFGYAAVQNGVMALYGNVYDTRQPIQSAQLLSKTYAGSPDEAGAIHVAHEFANDIIAKFGGASLLGSRIYFTSTRRGSGANGTELWVMDWDGNNQRQLTSLRGQVAYPSISADGSRIAMTIWPGSGDPRPRIEMINTDTGRPINFYNQEASVNSAATFSPDGKRVFYSSSASGTPQLYSAGIDGRDFTRITSARGNPSEPKVNPKNPDVLLFVDGPPEQIYRMNAEGAGVQRVTDGTGEASNPAWSPNGQFVAFAWTRGYQSGKFNIFVMDIGNPQDPVQLTHGTGNERNENPVWAPDGKHLVFASTRSGHSQIYTMLADGSQVKQLTTEGINKYPVWGVK